MDAGTPGTIAVDLAGRRTILASVRTVVDRVNGMSAGWHLRVLVTLHVQEPFASLHDRLDAATHSY